MRKTIAQLEKENAELHAQLDNKFSTMSSEERCAVHENVGTLLFEMYQSYLKVGFSEQQAWELSKILIDNGISLKQTLF